MNGHKVRAELSHLVSGSPQEFKTTNDDIGSFERPTGQAAIPELTVPQRNFHTTSEFPTEVRTTPSEVRDRL